MPPMLNRNLKRSRTAHSPFTNCECCDGPTPKGKAQEKREWQREADRELRSER